jgi:hypothetical protein
MAASTEKHITGVMVFAARTGYTDLERC